MGSPSSHLPPGHTEGVYLGLKLLDSEEEGYTLAPWQLYCDRCIIDAILLLEVNIARAIHIKLPRNLHPNRESDDAFIAILWTSAVLPHTEVSP